MDSLVRFASLQDDIADAQTLSLCTSGRVTFLEIKMPDGDIARALLMRGRD